MHTEQLQRLTYEEALEEIAHLPANQRQLLCKATSTYLSNPDVMMLMGRLATLPEGDPERLANHHGLGYYLLTLLYRGHIPEEANPMRYGPGICARRVKD